MAAVKLLDRGGQQRLDRYELVAELASGGMATVFLGRILGAGGFQRFVAIKRLHPHLASEQEFVEMFLDEARLAASIHHPNVVPILEVGTSDRGYYLVMEYIEGDTLARLLARSATSRQRIPIPIVIRIVLDTLAGLHAAHELKDDNDHHLNLVHRDVSPQNILVGINGTARITDFGVARAATRLSSTRSGQLKGKLAYMAPEQARGGQIDRRADLFAVGTVLWEVLADKRLFKGEGEADTLNRVLFEPIPRLHDVDPEIPAELEVVTMKSLDRDPEKRYPTSLAFADELEKAARASSSIASVREVADYVQKVLGQDISQQREAVRAWLAQSEPSRTELDDRDIIIGVGGATTTSSSAVSIPPKTLSPTQASSGLLSEITRARRKRRDRILWGGAAASVAIVGGILLGLPRRDSGETTTANGSSSATGASTGPAHATTAPTTAPSPVATQATPPPSPSASATEIPTAPVAVPPPAPPAPVPVPVVVAPRPARPVTQLPPVTPPPPAPPVVRRPPAPPAPRAPAPSPPSDDIPKILTAEPKAAAFAMRGGTWLRAAVLAALGTVACGTNRGTDPAGRFFAVHNVMHAMGFFQAGPVNQGSLAEGQEIKLSLTLPATCVAVVAVGGNGVDDLALQLLDPEGKVVAEETSPGVEAVLRSCVDRPGAYAVRLRMSRGAGEFLVSSWTGGESSSDKGVAELTSGGTCQAPTIVAAGHVYTGNTDEGTDDAEGSCAGSSGGKERVYRLDLATRQRVVIELSAEFDSVLYLRQGDCDDDAAEVKCNDDAGPKRSRIDAVLDAGSYFVFVDGYGDEAGSYRLQVISRDAPTLSDVCRGARPLAASSRVVGAFSDGFDNVNAGCGREAKGIDAPFRFDIATRSRVRFVEKSTDFRPVVHVRRVCEDAATEVGCGDSGFSDDEAAWAGVLDAGAYWVFADGAEEGIAGGFTLSAETAPEGAGRSANAPAGDGCGDAVQLTGLSGRVEGDTFAAKDDVPVSCAANGGADVVYRLDLARRSRVTARLVGDESSHALAFERACGERTTEMACGLLVDRVVEPGPYFLVVDGARPESLGKFGLTYRVRDMVDVEAACTRVPSLVFQRKEAGTTAGAADKFSSACGVRSLSQGAPDRVYRFSVARRMQVRLTLEAQGFRGVVSLRRVCSEDGSELKCAEASDDASTVALVTVLDPGTYFAVVDGAGPKAQGPFTLRWEGVEESPKGRKPAR